MISVCVDFNVNDAAENAVVALLQRIEPIHEANATPWRLELTGNYYGPTAAVVIAAASLRAASAHVSSEILRAWSSRATSPASPARTTWAKASATSRSSRRGTAAVCSSSAATLTRLSIREVREYAPQSAAFLVRWYCCPCRLRLVPPTQTNEKADASRCRLLPTRRGAGGLRSTHRQGRSRCVAQG